MGNTKCPEKCFLFDLSTTNIPTNLDGIEYSIEMNGNVHFLTFHWDYENSDFINKNKYILKGLILNEAFPFLNNDVFYTVDNIQKIIYEAQVPRTPKQKLDNLLIFIHDEQRYEGDDVHFSRENTNCINKLYFKNDEELNFYIETLFELNYINRVVSNDSYLVTLTFVGLEYIIKLEDEGGKSKNCFIAMSFSNEAKPIRDSIKKAIRKTSFEPILIDEVNYESDLTINDAMIGFIRKSKFMVADFTHQKHGVYFEAGFALGLKKPVIYTCHIDDFKQTHFDTNHYPHIVYETYEDLEEKLIDKINAWII